MTYQYITTHTHTQHQLPADKSIVLLAMSQSASIDAPGEGDYSGDLGESCPGKQDTVVRHSFAHLLQCVCVSPADSTDGQTHFFSDQDKPNVLPRQTDRPKPAQQLVCGQKAPFAHQCVYSVLRTRMPQLIRCLQSFCQRGATAVESFHSTCVISMLIVSHLDTGIVKGGGRDCLFYLDALQRVSHRE